MQQMQRYLLGDLKDKPPKLKKDAVLYKGMAKSREDDRALVVTSTRPHVAMDFVKSAIDSKDNYIHDVEGEERVPRFYLTYPPTPP